MDSYSSTLILMVMHDQNAAWRLQAPLERQGFRTAAAHNGAAGLSMARTRVPDLIVLADDMPVMSGQQTLRHLRTDPLLRSVPVMMVTTNEDPASGVDEVAGADDYLGNSPDASDLVDRVRTALETGRGALRQIDLTGRDQGELTIEQAQPRPDYSQTGSRPE